MFGVRTGFTDKSRDVKRAVAEGNFRNLFHAAASLRKTAAGLIERAPAGVASAPGEPPHTHRGVFYRRALRFDVDKAKQDAVIGFRFSVIGDVGAVHEFGEERGGVDFPVRATIGPALDIGAPRIGGQWQSSIGA